MLFPKPFCIFIICFLPIIIVITIFRLIFAIPIIVFTIDEEKRTIMIESKPLQCYCCWDESFPKIFNLDEIAGADVVESELRSGKKLRYISMIYNNGTYQIITDVPENCSCCCLNSEIDFINDLIIRFRANFGGNQQIVQNSKDLEEETTLG